MKTITLFINFLLLTTIGIFAQSNMTIQSGGAVTVNGNTTIIQCSISAPTSSTSVPSSTQIIWNWNPVPGASGYKWNTINDYSTAIDVGVATSKIETGLNYNTTYTRYVWAYVVIGSDNSTSTTQTTLPGPTGCGTITDSRDGKTYTTVQIGTQCWMAQNLNIGTKVLASFEQTNNGIFEKYCYNDDENNCTIYGGLYQWAEMVQYLNGATNNTSWNPVPTGNVVGICPTGWHIPTDQEWCILTTYIDPTVNCNVIGLYSGANAGGKMKETGTTHWLSPNTGATNSSGFTAFASGYRYMVGGFTDLPRSTNFYAATEYSPTQSYTRGLWYEYSGVRRDAPAKVCGFPTRCIKDN